VATGAGSREPSLPEAERPAALRALPSVEELAGTLAGAEAEQAALAAAAVLAAAAA